MQIKLDAKLMKAVYGLMVFITSIYLLAINDPRQLWLIGLFMLFGAIAHCAAWYLDGMKDISMLLKTSFLLLFSIVFLTNIEALILSALLFLFWGMLEAAIILTQKFESIKAQEGYWFVYAGLICITLLLGIIACFALNGVLLALPILFASLIMIFEYCEQFLPKVSVRIAK